MIVTKQDVPTDSAPGTYSEKAVRFMCQLMSGRTWSALISNYGCFSAIESTSGKAESASVILSVIIRFLDSAAAANHPPWR